MYSLALGGILGYLLGSVPTAFLLVRWKSRVDIRREGSGNVGTLNSYQVTGSKAIGLVVLILDVLKGLVPVALLQFEAGSWGAAAGAGIGAVLGHNFPVWLRFQGGRGLATAAGVVAPLCWPAVLTWGCVWGGGFLATRKVNIANSIATVFLLVLFFVVDDSILSRFLPSRIAPAEFRWFVTVVLVLVLAKHIQPVMEYVRE